MEELTLDHKSGELHIHLLGKEVQLRDKVMGTLGLATFKDSADAMRFVSEYIGNLEEPTEEFKSLFPQFWVLM